MKTTKPLNILFTTSEVFPLIKTGGLADVSFGLPNALKNSGHDIAMAIPGYRDVITKIEKSKTVHRFANGSGQLLQSQLPGTRVKLFIVDIPALFDRPGGPYQSEQGEDWHDNATRFYQFSKVCADLAMNRFGVRWQPDVVHSNDWQTALVPALLAREHQRPATIFTIHNIAYQGLFSWETFQQLGLPADWWTMDKLEFYGRLSFIKGGLVYADRINTVSPTYAKEICTPHFGFGLEGLLNYRADVLSGILNGVDDKQWNPSKDERIAQNYSSRSLPRKTVNKTSLQAAMGLPQNTDIPLIGAIGRMVEQKGYDLILDALPTLMQQRLQLAVLGSGDKRFEKALTEAQSRYPGKFAVRIGYDEDLAHLIEAGADMFLMPSRFEPCGLNQIYSLYYGTLPIVHHTGGLADSVVDATDETITNGTATGFQFNQPSAAALLGAVGRALALFHRPKTWQGLMKTAMSQDFGWPHAAEAYERLYNQAIVDKSQ